MISMNVINITIILISEIIDARLSKIFDIFVRLNNEEIIEQVKKKKYHISKLIITGKFITIITTIINTPNVFFIIKKLLKTDERVSPIPPPTIGIKVPDTNFIPFNTRLSEELVSML